MLLWGGERGLGCAKACAISCKLVAMMSVDELFGKTTLDGNQEIVSQMQVDDRISPDFPHPSAIAMIGIGSRAYIPATKGT